MENIWRTSGEDGIQPTYEELKLISEWCTTFSPVSIQPTYEELKLGA